MSIRTEFRQTDNVFKVFSRIFQHLIDEVKKAKPNIHIFFHGYAIASGKEVIQVGDHSFIGPWLRPAFAKRSSK